ncbi:diguanylate cyclase [Pseudoalteromonas sp. SWXJZ94C]|uniref:sensor domain-containing diguanylate cyclase n=1 Tax=Pseudoalteromonas sp. SWXJZ94C TaxID=2792065 RepID=UPI002F410241
MEVYSINKMRDTLSVFPLAILLHDNSTNSYYANKSAQKLFHIDEEKLCNRAQVNITFMSPQSKKRFSIDALFDRYINPHTDNHIILNIKKDKLRLNAKLANLSNTLSLITFEHIHTHIDEQNHFDNIISKISTELIDIQNDNINDQIDYALKAIGNVCHADRSYLFKFSNDRKSMSNTHEWVNEGVTPFIDRLQNVPDSELPYFFDVMNVTHIFKASDTSELPQQAKAEKDEFELQKIKSVLCIGLRYDKEIVGFIGCDCVKKQRDWSDVDLIRLKLVGEMIANAFKNINYKEELEQTQRQLINANQKLNELANTDGLTNIANRRRFDETLKNEIKRCARHKQSICLIICDIDFFKLYNDNYGHQRGDETLKRVASSLHNLCKRQGDLAARYGGEEFAIILPATNSTNCKVFTALIQKEIAMLAINHNYSNVAKHVTLSIGFYTLIPDKTTTPESIIHNADKALYIAKETGRNKVSEFVISNQNKNS